MDSLKYSIIYVVIRPEISEKISIGMIIYDGESIDVRYSRLKINALTGLLPQKECVFVTKVVSQIKRKKRLNTLDDVNYLARYSNNLIAFSPLKSIDVPPTAYSKNWLYKKYVYTRV
ncbi:hypothetical protein [Xylanibacter ruminicola]|uniref:hypothetical protein n=1 Tax=Xylanibacter ruminicola TaxID=839 RepID=UPI00049119A7|nr:hypothetical protein [Xylanibacter ruminicola]